ncbi:nitrous oxide reductase accessory protein NosL [Geomesophilobacter sediminis]|uniref:Nitrous oxide reductase accessory protein NosL n=1 Tax=Geomesophilobacter sediminis TaxID=2798584 RepID=A0A8J7JHH1_9BACT|nr:nitrous oxide reductase accessory protein NosL [Geomesophilobacter sediminis]MBJ6723915.1 nitrous oxide reductase accessory protein NosL [Geomesophilobacter sediminis]
MAKYVNLLVLFAITATLVLLGCGKEGPEPIVVGRDNCANCGMQVSDARFGAELITRKGRIFKFDSVECMAGFLNKKGRGEEVSSLWVVDCAHPSQLIEATRAGYLESEKLPSPMGLNLSAFRDRAAATAKSRECPGTILSWPEVQKYVGQRWS